MRRWVIRRLWLFIIIAVLVGGTLLNRLMDLDPTPVFTNSAGQHFRGYTSDGTLYEPPQSDVAEVEKALDARARAVLDGDRAAFLAGVDTDRRRFAAGQRTVWANTRKFSFAKLSYTYDGVLTPDRPLSTPSFLVRVSTTYQLKGYDSSPEQVDDGFTFVKQHGAWKLASVSDADHQFNKMSLPVPWDGAAITTYGDGDYLVVVDRGRKAMARRILALCHEGNRRSGELLGLANTRPTVVLATSRATGYHKFVGLDAYAVTYSLTGPDGVTPGWRVFVNPEYVRLVSRSSVVLPHELTHLATQAYLTELPAWLTEGAAEYVGWHGQGGLAAELRARGFSGPVDLSDRLPSSRTFYHQGVQLDYAEGTALVTWIEQHDGKGAVLSLMRAFESAGGYVVSFDPDKATPAILHDTLGITPTALAQAAYAELNATTTRS